MKALVCGGRNFSDKEKLFQSMDHCRKWWNLTMIITGGARGVDSLAHQWAKEKSLNTDVHYAQWDTYGKAAGAIRNRRMLEEEPDVVIAFPGGTGTEHMITIARQAGVPVFIIS